MKVLVVSAHFPYPPRWGFAMRVYQLARELAKRHEVTLLSYATSDDENVTAVGSDFAAEVVRRDPPSVARKRIQQLRSLVSPLPYEARATYSSELQAAVDRLCAETRFDVVQLESPLVAGLRFPPGTALVLDEHNIEYEVFERMAARERSPLRRTFYRLEHARFRRFEQRVWQSVAGCAVTSEREAPVLRRHAPRLPVQVVPNGVDADYFRPSGAAVDPDEIVFNGVLDYRPNVDAATFLLDDVLPIVRRRRPGVHVTLVGRTGDADVAPFTREGVELTGEVPDVRPFLERAAVVAVPIRMGGGTRLKVVEGLALARPMVSTSLGCEGVGVRDGQELLVGDTAEAFAEQLLRLLEDRGLADRLGRAGRDLMQRECSWQAAAGRLEGLYEMIMGPAGEVDPDPRPLLAARES